MEKDELSVEDLERLAAAMAAAIPNLECPECCDCGWVYQYVEKSAGFFREEWEWAYFANAIVQYRLTRKSASPGQTDESLEI